MTPDQFANVQQYLIIATLPFIQFWVMVFLTASIILAILIFFLMVIREILVHV